MQRYEEILIKNDQEHILNYIGKLENEKKQNLIKEVENINYEQLKKLYEESKKDFSKAIKSVMIEHIPFFTREKLGEDKCNELISIGEDIIKQGKYAVVTMAGGQGTRLGHDGPKGTFKLDVNPEPKYLFQIIAENLIRNNEKYEVELPWYIMTSTENNEKTVAFFEEYNFFGYKKENIKFFNQGNLPLLNEDGKLIIDENYNIKIASDGNGSIYKSMKRDGILDDMKKRGVEWIFIGSVDNVLLNMVDPLLIGLTISENNEIASKSVAKRNANERVGVFCKKNGKPGIIEYTELPEDMAIDTDEDGELLFGESNIICHLYNIKALETLADKELPYHSAHKKANYIDEDGNLFKATEPNAYKYESFIFDGFGYFDNMSILRCKREENFAPIKNKEGNDSPETAIKLYNDFWK